MSISSLMPATGVNGVVLFGLLVLVEPEDRELTRREVVGDADLELEVALPGLRNGPALDLELAALVGEIDVRLFEELTDGAVGEEVGAELDVAGAVDLAVDLRLLHAGQRHRQMHLGGEAGRARPLDLDEPVGLIGAERVGEAAAGLGRDLAALVGHLDLRVLEVL